MFGINFNNSLFEKISKRLEFENSISEFYKKYLKIDITDIFSLCIDIIVELSEKRGISINEIIDNISVNDINFLLDELIITYGLEEEFLEKIYKKLNINFGEISFNNKKDKTIIHLNNKIFDPDTFSSLLLFFDFIQIEKIKIDKYFLDDTSYINKKDISIFFIKTYELLNLVLELHEVYTYIKNNNLYNFDNFNSFLEKFDYFIKKTEKEINNIFNTALNETQINIETDLYNSYKDVLKNIKDSDINDIKQIYNIISILSFFKFKIDINVYVILIGYLTTKNEILNNFVNIITKSNNDYIENKIISIKKKLLEVFNKKNNKKIVDFFIENLNKEIIIYNYYVFQFIENKTEIKEEEIEEYFKQILELLEYVETDEYKTGLQNIKNSSSIYIKLFENIKDFEIKIDDKSKYIKTIIDFVDFLLLNKDLEIIDFYILNIL